ncbi:hypothetical protein E4U57_001356 [Claviceps arundinis]|uniref:Uncharacterized protein n=1 Tax=Claviceps arundinis TaxID=1623583 RepID=A0A9P7MQG0_9HYPO|nr:hypothetical protein E4U57_001356 [Claviceps arundinis]KAG5964481.1 hypothetical protein E4U56_002187 [Claviceps arundinis]
MDSAPESAFEPLLILDSFEETLAQARQTPSFQDYNIMIIPPAHDALDGHKVLKDIFVYDAQKRLVTFLHDIGAHTSDHSSSKNRRRKTYKES